MIAGQGNAQRQLLPDDSSNGGDPSSRVSWRHRTTARVLGMRRKAATAVLAILSISLGIYAIFGHDGIVAYQQKQHQAQQLQQQILTLQKENQRLALHDQRLQSDRDTIEYEARYFFFYYRAC